MNDKTQIFIDIQDMEARYAEELYKDYIREQYNKLQSNWNSLREWVQSEYNRYLNDTENLIHSNVEVIDFSRMLDKMNELEGKDKE